MKEMPAFELLDSDSFEGVDVLFLPHSQEFPAAAWANLMAYLEAGGDMILLGGVPFSEGTALYRGELLTRDAIERLRLNTEIDVMIDDFSSLSDRNWLRDGKLKGTGSTRVLENVGESTALKMEMRGYLGTYDWDIFKLKSPDAVFGFDASLNTVMFKARSETETPNLAMVLEELDGTRWVTEIPLNTGWTEYAIPISEFEIYNKGKGSIRGGPDDGPVVENLNGLAVGLVFNIVRVPSGDHVVFLDDLGLGACDLPMVPSRIAPLSFPLDMERRYFSEAKGIRPVSEAEDVELFQLSGYSAFAPEYVGKSVFRPILQAIDAEDRRLGWVLSEYINYAGGLKNSRWLISGVNASALFDSEMCREAILDWLRQNGEPVAPGGGMVLEVSEVPPEEILEARRLTINHARSRFIDANGDEVFLRGVNYLGPWNRDMLVSGDELFDVASLEADFKKASKFGINAFRLWFNEDAYLIPHKRQALLDLAAKYNIYLMIHLRGEGVPENFPGLTLDSVLERTRLAVRALGDHPMIMGYDISNEPYLGLFGALSYMGEKNPVLQYRAYDKHHEQMGEAWSRRIRRMAMEKPPWPKVTPWLEEEDRLQLYAFIYLWDKAVSAETNQGLDWSTLTGLEGKIEFDGQWAELLEVANDGLSFWLEKVRSVILEEEPDALLSVGYHSALAGLSANAPLDFISHHTYQKPRGMQDTVTNYTTMDRLSQAWPEQVVMLGEFGYSTGDQIGTDFLGEGEVAIGEMIFYLHAHTMGYGGVFKWELNDKVIPTFYELFHWRQEDEMSMLYQTGFGVFAVDGTDTGRPKQFAYAMRAFEKYQNSELCVGELQVREGENRTQVAFTYRSEHALIVGDSQYHSDGVKWAPDEPSVLTMWRDAVGIHISSSSDASVRIGAPWFSTIRELKLLAGEIKTLSN